MAPALAAHHEETVLALWQRDGLSARDRSLVTVAHLIAGGQTTELGFYVDKALDDGVEPREISETVTHLAFYSGWQNARAAVPATGAVFDEHGVDAADLPAAEPDLLPLDETAEQARDNSVRSDYGAVAPGVVDNTRDVLFRELWLRPDLEPRDRSLVTVVALVTTGQSAQITFHLNRAMNNGLTQPEVGETLNHLAFYAGWPKVFSALPVVRDVLNSRACPRRPAGRVEADGRVVDLADPLWSGGQGCPACTPNARNSPPAAWRITACLPSWARGV